MTAPGPDGDSKKEAVLRSLARSGSQMRSALSSGVEGPGRIPGMSWDMAQLGAHLVTNLRELTKALHDEPCAYDGSTEGGTTASVDERLVAQFPVREMVAIADCFAEELDGFSRAVEARRGDDLVPAIAPHATVSAIAAIFVLDHHNHGTQISGAGGPSWQLDVEDVRLGVATLVPATLDRNAIRGFRGTFSLHLRGSGPIPIAIRSGDFEVDQPAGRVDCHVYADPVAFLRVNAGGFMSRRRAIATGKMFAFGRRPWKALELPRLIPPVDHGGKALRHRTTQAARPIA